MSWLRGDIIRWSSGIITQIFSLSLLVLLFLWFYKRRKLVKQIEKIPGPRAWPIVGNALDANIDIVDLFPLGITIVKMFGPVMRVWLGTVPLVVISGAKQAESILSSHRHIDKSRQYSFFHPWMGNTGLLVANSDVWTFRRKLLTPAFHLQILDQFVETFHRQSLKMVDKLARFANTGEVFDIYPLITNCTLDTICETTMGTNINAQDYPESEYVEAVHRMQGMVQKRMLIFWQQPEFAFRLLGYAKEQDKLLKTLHNFTRNIVKRRREMFERLKKEKQEGKEEGKKPRLAFLDLLLEYSEGGKVLSDEDIREEVDLFVFAGHDTTAVAINWCLYLLGRHPKIQARVQAELDEIFGNCNRVPTTEDLRKMRYTENCIKESLRIYPSVPYFGRWLRDDLKIDQYVIPAGTTIMVLPYMIHRDPEQFPEPDRFEPDRFLPENAAKRHPFSYLPFSAGPRNCIGQKFGLLEEKVLLSNFLRKYSIESVTPPENIVFRSEIVLRPKDGIWVRLARRDCQKGERSERVGN